MPKQSIQELRLGINRPLTNLTLGFIQPEYCMQLLFPLVTVGSYGGQVVCFDDTIYEDVDDSRADDGQYSEIHSSYYGRPYTIKTKGLAHPITDRERKETSNLSINWSQHATMELMNKGSLRHEIEATEIATTLANYETTNRITLSGTDQFSDPTNSQPGEVIRAGKSAVSAQIGVEPNVCILGKDVFDVMQEHPYVREYIKYTSRDSVTEDILAQIWGFDRLKVSQSIKKVAGVKSRIMGRDIVMAYVNPAALNADRLPYVPQGGAINRKNPSYGYTYVMEDMPQIKNPLRQEERSRTLYMMDFDRSVELTGVDKDSGLVTHGYLIKDAVAA